MIDFEGYDRRKTKIDAAIKKFKLKSLENCRDLCLSRGIDVEKIVRDTQPICFDNAVWAYTLGCAIALNSNKTSAPDMAKLIGEGLQAFTVPYSVADTRAVGLGHGNLAAKLLSEDTKCFCRPRKFCGSRRRNSNSKIRQFSA